VRRALPSGTGLKWSRPFMRKRHERDASTRKLGKRVREERVRKYDLNFGVRGCIGE